MFVLTLMADTIRIPPQLLSSPTATSVQTEIEKRYPNKIIMDVGLVICPYGPPLEIGHGMLVPADGGAHHQVIFQCLVFRPFVGEVLIGTVTESNEAGIKVSVGGFFDYVFIPAYWMLNPSKFDASTGLWVWTPDYGDDGGGSGEEDGEERRTNGEHLDAGPVDATPGEDEEEEGGRFEMEVGATIRFRVKSVNFTRITTTMKGVQATTSTTSHASGRAYGLNGSSHAGAGGRGDDHGEEDGAVRRRRSSSDLSDADKHPAPMHIVGSICEDGLGLLSWWQAADEDEEEHGEEEGREEDGGGHLLN